MLSPATPQDRSCTTQEKQHSNLFGSAPNPAATKIAISTLEKDEDKTPL
jgi:hypothetical protein